jgi:hypothetical protein
VIFFSRVTEYILHIATIKNKSNRERGRKMGMLFSCCCCGGCCDDEPSRNKGTRDTTRFQYQAQTESDPFATFLPHPDRSKMTDRYSFVPKEWTGQAPKYKWEVVNLSGAENGIKPSMTMSLYTDPSYSHYAIGYKKNFGAYYATWLETYKRKIMEIDPSAEFIPRPADRTIKIIVATNPNLRALANLINNNNNDSA